MVKPTGPINPVIKEEMIALEKAYRKTKKKIWLDIVERLKRPRRIRSEVNLIKIQRYAKEGEYVVVPGKLLGYGNINKPLIITALSCSQNARKKVELCGGKVISFTELIKMNKMGHNIRIIG